jgi:hypothetical protein
MKLLNRQTKKKMQIQSFGAFYIVEEKEATDIRCMSDTSNHPFYELDLHQLHKEIQIHY